MSEAATTAAVTAEQLADLPEDGLRHELVEGELRSMAPAGFEHGEVAAAIGARLRRFAEEHRLGSVVAAETGFLLARDPDTVRAADAAFVRTHRLPPPGERKGFLVLSPDLVVEVVSPSDRAGEVAGKVSAWLAAGTLMVWVIYPAQRLAAVHRPDGGARLLRDDDALDGADVLPGFCVPLGEILG